MTVRIIVGDVRQKLAELPDESVHCVVTSPPYYGLRDYGVEGQIGLEASPDEYIETMVGVFRDVRRVLRSNGTLWLNLGDSYAGSGKGGNPDAGKQATNAGSQSIGVLYGKDGGQQKRAAVTNVTRNVRQSGIKPKDLIGIPWMLAFALRADGWWLRQDIIWLKPNPMPESVTDRCTKAHEYLFLLSKSERYWFDAAAIRENRASVGGGWVNGWAGDDGPHTPVAHARDKGDARSFRGGGKYTGGREKSADSVSRGVVGNGPALSERRNKRSVWTVASEPFPDAHFATFPPALIRPCIMAGCPKGGVVLDPFGGAGTTGLVADRLGRDAIMIELNPKYAEMAKRRIERDAGPLLAKVAAD